MGTTRAQPLEGTTPARPLPRAPRRATGRIAGAVLAAGAVALPLLAVPAAGQDGRSGAPLLTVGVTAGLSANDNIDLDPDGGSARVGANARLDFAYAVATRIQSLTLSGDVDLRAISDGDGDDEDLNGFGGPRLRFAYARAVPDARLAVNGFLNRSRIAFSTLELLDPDLDLDDPDIVSVDLIEERDEGTRLRFGLDGSLTLRADAPLNVVLSAGVSGDRYSDGAVQGDEDRARLGVGLGFQLNAVTRASLDLGYSVFDEEADADGLDDADRRESVRLSVRLTRDLQRGQLGVSTNATRTENGDRYGLTFNATRELTPLLTVGARVGATRETSDDTTLVGGLSLSRELARGRVALDFDRRVISGEDDEERELTSLRASYGVDLTPLTSLGANAIYRRSAASGDGQDDESAGSVGVDINRQLAEKLSLSAGLRHRFEDDGGGTAHDNVLSLNLRRAVSFRP